MYERFYNLRERPFSLSPDPDFLYPSRVHKEALGYLRYGIEGRAGFIVVTGEIGCGKTTLLQTLIRGLDRQISISRLVNTMLDARELLEALILDFGIDVPHGRGKPQLLRDLARYLVEQRNAGRLALLIIDEAQNLGLSALEEIRMLSNLETEKSKLIQIVLVGQPSLRELLARRELEQLQQRITVSYHLQPLDSDETAAYIHHRLRRAAIGAPMEFPAPVTTVIHEHSGGVPRKINVIADAILLFGYGEERRVIDLDLTREVLEELESTGVIAPPSSPPIVSEAPVPPNGRPDARDIERQLAAREARVAERERQLAEQRQVMLEEYRRMRTSMAAPPGEPPGGAAPRWPPSQTAPAAAAVLDRPTQPAAAAALSPAAWPAGTSRYYRAAPPVDESESVWTRVRRTLRDAARPWSLFESRE